MELWQFISLVVTTITVAIAGTWRVSALLNAQRIETRDLLADLQKDNHHAHGEIGKRIDTQGLRLETYRRELGERISAQGSELGDRIDSVRQELGDRIDAQGKELGDRINAQGKELGDRIDAQGKELGDRINAVSVQVAGIVGREEGRESQ